MNLQNLLNQFTGSGNTASGSGSGAQGIGDTLSKLTSNIPGGLAGGAAAGGIMVLLVSNKSARKFAGTAATYGGAALLGSLAYKAYKNWQQNNSNKPAAGAVSQQAMAENDTKSTSVNTLTPDFQLALIKAMIAAAKSDGHIDATEQQRIFQAVQQMELSTEMKAMVFDLLRNPISVEEITPGLENMEQKSELYLASCMVINPDHPSEQVHLDNLAVALKLPPDLAQQLQWQANQVMAEAAWPDRKLY